MKHLPLILMGLILGAFGLFLLLGDSGYFSYRATLAKYEDLVLEINRLRKENQLMKQEISMLNTDPDFQEYVLRKEMNLVRPEEILILFDKGNPNDSSNRKD